MKNRYINRLSSTQSRRKQFYHTKNKLAEEPTISELLQQLKSQQEEKEKNEKE